MSPNPPASPARPEVSGVAGLAKVAVAYGNDNELSGRRTMRQAVPYVVAAVVIVAAAVLIFLATCSPR